MLICRCACFRPTEWIKKNICFRSFSCQNDYRNTHGLIRFIVFLCSLWTETRKRQNKTKQNRQNAINERTKKGEISINKRRFVEIEFDLIRFRCFAMNKNNCITLHSVRFIFCCIQLLRYIPLQKQNKIWRNKF